MGQVVSHNGTRRLGVGHVARMRDSGRSWKILPTTLRVRASLPRMGHVYGTFVPKRDRNATWPSLATLGTGDAFKLSMNKMQDAISKASLQTIEKLWIGHIRKPMLALDPLVVDNIDMAIEARDETRVKALWIFVPDWILA